MPRISIDKLIDSRERKVIFWVGVVQSFEINTHAPFSVSFFDREDVQYPLRILCFANETDFFQSCDLIMNLLVLFIVESSAFLWNGHYFWLDIKFVRHNSWVNARHVNIRPSKDLRIYTPKVGRSTVV